jgi:nicotinamide riboside transporter PnuC
MRLDYISCILTIGSTILVGRRFWQGWIVAGVNSLIICYIGLQTSQIGFVPANLFCIALYAYNIMQWRQPMDRESQSVNLSDRLLRHFNRRKIAKRALLNRVIPQSHDSATRGRNRIRRRHLSAR